jgi:23S rRNA (cytosine1962-C5)-methyltransferase
MAPDSTLPTLRLKPREDRRLRAGHLWVYSNEIDVAATPLKAIEPGAVVRLLSHQGKFLGCAGVSPHGLIAARVLSRDEDRPPGKSLFVHRLKVALGLRERLYPGGCYRLLFGESDLLPGLVADRYGDVVVLQAATATAEAMKGELVDAVREVLAPRGILWRNDGSARDVEGLPRYVEVAHGEVPESAPLNEGGVDYEAPVHGGQKTGWFYDQRDNRARLERYRPVRVLDVFCYTGAWGLSAAVRGAEAAFVDSSPSALAAVANNAARLGVAAETHRGSAFDVLKALRADGRRFDAVVVDPPAFIKRRKDHRKGLTAYQRINQLALTLLEREGLLVTCSCSHHLSVGELLTAVERAARHVDRFVQVLEIGGQAADHPVHPAIPETRYLKALFCRVLPT